MTLKCKARRSLPPFFVIVKVTTNHLNFKLNTSVEKNPGPTQNNTDFHETRGPPMGFREQGNMTIYFLGNKGYLKIPFREQGNC